MEAASTNVTADLDLNLEAQVPATPFPRRQRALEMEMGPAAKSSRAQAVAKRGFDLLVSTIGLIALSPLLIAIAIAIKLDSPGPLIFAQRRVGRGGRSFAMLKFRTMVDGADEQKAALLHLNEAADGLFKITQDPRITRVGAFLRSTSLDELPQLIDVLRGEMSLVGPRPLVEDEDVKIAGPLRKRLDVRPGMTGPWQVAGASKVPLHEMAVLDNQYVETQSFTGDVNLILMTIPHVVFRRGI